MTCGFVIILLVTFWSITIISSGPIEPFQVNQFDNYPSSGESTDIQPDDNSVGFPEETNDLNPAQINLLTLNLLEILQGPWEDHQLPIVYIEDMPTDGEESELSGPVAKRSRYYRQYPFKRHNSRHRMYDPENKYMCQPSRAEVYKLLVALHDSRSGDRNRQVSFCNRRRTASAIYTNIRFLG